MYILRDAKQLDYAEVISSLKAEDTILLIVNGEYKQITFANFAKSLGITNVPSSAPKFTGNVNDYNTEYEVYGGVWD